MVRKRSSGALTLVPILTLVCAVGCGGETRRRAVPPDLQAEAHIAGYPEEVRYFIRDPGDIRLMEKEFTDSWDREKAALHVQKLPPTAYLAISGGGDKGAFTAGFLNGWSAAGTRPQFKLVTGVSTGALIAPFAFLGPAYDNDLKAIYTGVSQRDIVVKRFIYSVYFQDAMADTAPLAKLLGVHVTQKMLDEIAAEYAKGRLLYIGTTNLDARRTVVWNVTRIAASHRPGALDLVRKIMLASAAIPGAFPPVMIDVEANGKSYDEMHVDGGATAQVFVYWSGVRLKALAAAHGAERERKVYIMVNARLDPEWGEVERRTLPITLKSIETLLNFHVIGDLYRIYAITERDGTDFNVALIQEDFQVSHGEDFDPSYMKKLYQYGYGKAAGGYHWLKEPPMRVGEERATHP